MRRAGYRLPPAPMTGSVGTFVPTARLALPTLMWLTPSSIANSRVGLLAFLGSFTASRVRSPGLKYVAPT
jgi:hypothetical protein